MQHRRHHRRQLYLYLEIRPLTTYSPNKVAWPKSMMVDNEVSFPSQVSDGLPPVPTGALDDILLKDPHTFTVSGILAVTFASLSIATALLASYWFLKMTRKFRHDLIMIIIETNMFKDIWFMLFPVVQFFVVGPITSDSKFCQVSGFFLSIGVEASDFSILALSVHTALAVFKRPPPKGEGGLYPYRYWAYAFIIFFTVLLSALAFTNHPHAFTAQGSACYLPSRPAAYLNLTWVPRYTISIVIIILYPGIYFYVEAKFRRSQKEMRREPNEVKENTTLELSSESESVMRGQSHEDGVEQWSNNGENLENELVHKRCSFHRKHRQLTDSDIILNPTVPCYTKWKHKILSRLGLQRQAFETASSSSKLSLPLRQDTESTTSGQTVAEVQASATHKAMLQQLRHLFIYPAIFILCWIPSFVSYLLKNDRAYIENPSRALSFIIVILPCLEGTIYCLFFSWLEKPWRHIRGSNGTFFGSFMCLAIRKRRAAGRRLSEADDQLSTITGIRRLQDRGTEYSPTRENAQRRQANSPANTGFWWDSLPDPEDEAESLGSEAGKPPGRRQSRQGGGRQDSPTRINAKRRQTISGSDSSFWWDRIPGLEVDESEEFPDSKVEDKTTSQSQHQQDSSSNTDQSTKSIDSEIGRVKTKASQ